MGFAATYLYQAAGQKSKPLQYINLPVMVNKYADGKSVSGDGKPGHVVYAAVRRRTDWGGRRRPKMSAGLTFVFSTILPIFISNFDRHGELFWQKLFCRSLDF